MKTIIWVGLVCLSYLTEAQPSAQPLLIGPGQMPNVTRDQNGIVHLVYGKGDSILYVSTRDGRSFTSPFLIAVLPKLYSFAMRGPQIAAATNGLVVTACTQAGDIYAFHKEAAGTWTKPQRLNNPETAKEGLMALCADGLSVYAVWLNVKQPKGQAVQGARSSDGGQTWRKSVLVYDSPAGSVCECCKPSVAVNGEHVYVQFRNNLNGNRDLYLVRSVNGGQSFGGAQKLGVGSWHLDGCPMDGGGLVLDKGQPLTVWRREATLYAAVPGEQEKEIGEGRSPSLEMAGGSAVYAWTKDGNVIVTTEGKTKTLGKGSQPQLKALNGKDVLCVWESGKRVLGAVVTL